MKTATISFRVPVDFKDQITKICKDKNISITDYCITNLTPSNSLAPVRTDVVSKLEKGGLLNKKEPFNIPETMNDILSVTGGSLVGIVVYRALKDNIQQHDKDFTDEKIEIISVAAGVASAFLSGMAINEMLKSK